MIKENIHLYQFYEYSLKQMNILCILFDFIISNEFVRLYQPKASHCRFNSMMQLFVVTSGLCAGFIIWFISHYI